MERQFMAGSAGPVEEEDRTIHDDTRDVLAELRFLRNHLTSVDSVHHGQNTERLDKLEATLKEQNELLQKISVQTACIPDLKKDQDDHADRIDQLESDRDKVKGGKTVLGWILMAGAGALGAWVTKLFGPHGR